VTTKGAKWDTGSYRGQNVTCSKPYSRAFFEQLYRYSLMEKSIL